MLDPQRAVLVECSDPLGGRHELRTGLVGRRLDEVKDRLLRGPVVPRRERVLGESVVDVKQENGEQSNAKSRFHLREVRMWLGELCR